MIYFTLVVLAICFIAGLISLSRFTLGHLMFDLFVMCGAISRVVRGQYLWIEIPIAILFAYLLGRDLRKLWRKEWLWK